MNVKELAGVAGVSVSTIRRVSKRLFPDLLKNGVKANFTKDQCFDIMSNTNRKNEVELPSAFQPMQNSEQVEQVNVESIAKAVAIAMQSVMLPMMEKLLNNQKALHGMALKKSAKNKGIELKKIPDERWGHVNSYPINILDEHFST